MFCLIHSLGTKNCKLCEAKPSTVFEFSVQLRSKEPEIEC